MNKRNRTAKRQRVRPTDFQVSSKLVSTLLEMLMTVKMYHWHTTSYAQHKATDELYERLNKHIDTFIEVLLGKTESRIQAADQKLPLYNYGSEQDFKKKMYEYRKMLQGLSHVFSPETDSDLLTIRDELLIDVNQFLYLMSFR
jgi:hypothetical protein